MEELAGEALAASGEKCEVSVWQPFLFLLLVREVASNSVATLTCAEMHCHMLQASCNQHTPAFLPSPSQLKVTGLLGGHSGLMIGEGRANALVLLARTLK